MSIGHVKILMNNSLIWARRKQWGQGAEGQRLKKAQTIHLQTLEGCPMKRGLVSCSKCLKSFGDNDTFNVYSNRRLLNVVRMDCKDRNKGRKKKKEKHCTLPYGLFII